MCDCAAGRARSQSLRCTGDMIDSRAPTDDQKSDQKDILVAMLIEEASPTATV